MARRWVRRPEVLWRASLDRVLLLGPDMDEPLVVAGPGTQVWLLLAEPASAGAITAELGEVYEGAEEQIRRDVDELLGELADRGLVEARP